jgi:hypothetical protein
MEWVNPWQVADEGGSCGWNISCLLSVSNTAHLSVKEAHVIGSYFRVRGSVAKCWEVAAIGS